MQNQIDKTKVICSLVALKDKFDVSSVGLSSMAFYDGWNAAFKRASKDVSDLLTELDAIQQTATKQRVSTLGKLYQEVQNEIEKDAWINNIVEMVITDLNYSISVEQQTLPIRVIRERHLVEVKGQRAGVDKVLKALELKGIVAKIETTNSFVTVIIEDLL